MRRRLAVVLGTAVASLVLAGCSGTATSPAAEPTPTPSPSPRVSSAEYTALVLAIGDKQNSCATLHDVREKIAPASEEAGFASAKLAAVGCVSPDSERTDVPSITATPDPQPEETTKPTSFKTMTAREFKLLAKDADAHAGEAYRIYGYVSQFDSATGTNAFRAETGPRKLSPDDWYEFDQNCVLTGDEELLADVVEDDLFEAKVIVGGSFSYDTQIGGSTTVPMFAIEDIKVYGSKS